jgi:uncharacterized protein (UPF0332 family)
LDAAEILLKNDKPVEAASRAYYAAYQMVTAVLIKLKLNPRDEYGNWAHQETAKMFRTHLCRKMDLGFKEKQALINLLLKFRTLLETRYVADYGDPATIVASVAKSLWRDANQIVSLLNSLISRGAL